MTHSTHHDDCGCMKARIVEEIAGRLREERDRLRELIQHSPTEAARCTTSGRIAALTDAMEMVEE